MNGWRGWRVALAVVLAGMTIGSVIWIVLGWPLPFRSGYPRAFGADVSLMSYALGVSAGRKVPGELQDIFANGISPSHRQRLGKSIIIEISPTNPQLCHTGRQSTVLLPRSLLRRPLLCRLTPTAAAVSVTVRPSLITASTARERCSATLNSLIRECQGSTGTGVNPGTPTSIKRNPDVKHQAGQSRRLVGPVGLEPTTRGLADDPSTGILQGSS